MGWKPGTFWPSSSSCQRPLSMKGGAGQERPAKLVLPAEIAKGGDSEVEVLDRDGDPITLGEQGASKEEEVGGLVALSIP